MAGSRGDADDASAMPAPADVDMGPLGLRSLLDEVVERVEGVATLADRLQGLLSAVVTISSQLDLGKVLDEIVQTAAHVADAEYAALGVLAPGERRLSDFIHLGPGRDRREKSGRPASGGSRTSSLSVSTVTYGRRSVTCRTVAGCSGC